MEAFAGMGMLTPPPDILGSSLHAVTAAPGNGARSVVLTFDDGPRSGDTDQVAAELAARDVHATFFVLLVRARREASLLADLVAAGHEVALHGVDHRRLTGVDPVQLAETLADAAAELADLAGAPIRFFRPPYGAQDERVWTGTRNAGLVPVVWQRECREWDTQARDAAFDELDDLPLGAIILAHDTSATPGDGAEPVPVATVDRRLFTSELLDRLAAQHLTPTSLTTALRTGTPAWRVWLDAAAAGGAA